MQTGASSGWSVLVVVGLALGCHRTESAPPDSNSGRGGVSVEAAGAGSDGLEGAAVTSTSGAGESASVGGAVGCSVRCFRGQECVDTRCVGVGVLRPEELHAALGAKDFQLLNVGVPPEGIIPGTDDSISHETPDLLAEKIGADRYARVVLYCRKVPKSLDAIGKLRDRGYRSISYLEGGVVAWRASGYALQ